jgi:hypothetical protein
MNPMHRRQVALWFAMVLAAGGIVAIEHHAWVWTTFCAAGLLAGAMGVWNE